MSSIGSGIPLLSFGIFKGAIHNTTSIAPLEALTYTVLLGPMNLLLLRGPNSHIFLRYVHSLMALLRS